MANKTMPSQIAAATRYNKRNTVTKQIRLNKKYDSDIISFLEGCKSQMGFIKDAIRKSIRTNRVLTTSEKTHQNNADQA